MTPSRIAAHVAFWLCFFPVLAGAVTLLLVPQRIAHYSKGLETPGTDSYHRDMQRHLAVTIANAGVRTAAIPLLAGLIAAALCGAAWIRYTAFAATLLLACTHLMIPVFGWGPLMLRNLVSPMYYLPALAAVVAAAGLCLEARQRPL